MCICARSIAIVSGLSGGAAPPPGTKPPKPGTAGKRCGFKSIISIFMFAAAAAGSVGKPPRPHI
jgi:hypothetical protein